MRKHLDTSHCDDNIRKMHEKKFKGAAAGDDAQFMAIVTSTVANLWGTRGTSCTEPETLSIICANTVRRLAGRENTAGGPHRTDSMTAMSLMGGEDQSWQPECWLGGLLRPNART